MYLDLVPLVRSRRICIRVAVCNVWKGDVQIDDHRGYDECGVVGEPWVVDDPVPTASSALVSRRSRINRG